MLFKKLVASENEKVSIKSSFYSFAFRTIKKLTFSKLFCFLLLVYLQNHVIHSANPINRQHAKSPLPTATPAYYHPPHHSDPYQASSEEKGLINKNVQSTSFKLLQRALEHEEIMEGNDDHDNSHVMPKINTAPSQVKAPRIKDAANDDHDNKGS